jgi:ferric enterobactin receptor
MKSQLFAFILSLIAFNGFAQFPNQKTDPNKGHIFGKIITSEGEPVEFATLIIIKSVFDSTTNEMKDIVVKAQTSEVNGDFDFTELPLMSPIKLKISSVGYKELTTPIQFEKPDPSLFKGMKPGQAPDPAIIQKIMAGFNKDLGKLIM